MAKAPALPAGFELPREPKLFALELAIRMIDLTTLEGADTPGKVAALSSKAVRPDPSDPTVPSVAALCVYPNLVPHAVARLRDRKSTRLNSSHVKISYAVFCLKKKKKA